MSPEVAELSPVARELPELLLSLALLVSRVARLNPLLVRRVLSPALLLEQFARAVAEPRIPVAVQRLAAIVHRFPLRSGNRCRPPEPVLLRSATRRSLLLRLTL